MNKHLHILLLALAAALGLCACKPPVVTPPTPEEVTTADPKGYILKSCYDLLSVFQAEEQREAVELLDELTFKMQHADWAEVRDHYEGFAGVFELQDTTWRYVGSAGEDNHVVLRLPLASGNTCEMRCWGEGTEQTFTWQREIDGAERTFTGKLPEHVFVAVVVGETEPMRLSLDIDALQNDHYNVALLGRVANLRLVANLQATHSQLALQAEVNYSEKQLLQLHLDAPISLPYKTDDQTYDEYGQSLAINWINLVKGVGELKADMDLNHAMQVRLHVPHVGQFYQAYDDWMMAYDVRLVEDMKLYAAHAFRDVCNRHYDMGVFCGKDTLAQFIVDAYEKTDKTGDARYGVEPRIYFPIDQTRYALTEYFTETRFGNIITLTEDLLNEYISYLRFHQVETVDFIQH